MRKIQIIFLFIFSFLLLSYFSASAQLKWTNVDSLYQPLPNSVHVYFTDEKVDTGNFRAYYVEADLKGKNLEFTIDTTLNRRMTPKNYYERDNHPLVVTNCSFFSFATNRNVDVIIKDGKLICYDTGFVKGRGQDSLSHFFTLRSAIGFNKENEADIVWTAADSSMKFPIAFESPKKPLLLYEGFNNTSDYLNDDYIKQYLKPAFGVEKKANWKMQTAVGGGPVLVQNGEVKISNEEEMMFAGKAINDKHPRTTIGYTPDGRLIILMIEGRSPKGSGANLTEAAQILKDLGCWEAMNLDGGGSSYMLVNGKPTIKPSDVSGQRPVPAVFIIRQK